MMNLLARFSTKDVDALAKSMAEEIAKRYPPGADAPDKKKKSSPNRLPQILGEVYARTDAIRVERSLGVYRKAKLGNTFRWELKELGYDKEFVEIATQGLIIHLTKKAAAAAKAPPAAARANKR